MKIRKRDGRIVAFDDSKITDAILQQRRLLAVQTAKWRWKLHCAC